jgi:hypothetical protein
MPVERGHSPQHTMTPADQQLTVNERGRVRTIYGARISRVPAVDSPVAGSGSAIPSHRRDPKVRSRSA